MKIKKRISKNIYLIAVILLSAFLPLILYNIMGGNLFYDSFSYFNYALALAGFKDFANVAYANLPPLIPFLLSLFMGTGIMGSWTFFVVDHIFYSLTILFSYLLLKLIIPKKYAFLGMLILIFNPIVIISLFRGLVDIALLFWIILSFYIVISGFKNSSKALYFLSPVLALLFLTKFVGVLIAIPIFFYIFIQWKESNLGRDKVKKIAIGIIGAFLLVMPHMIYSYWTYRKFIPYLWQIQETFFSSISVVVVRAETLDGGSYSRIQVISSIPYYFIGSSNFENLTGISYFVLVLFSVIGLLNLFIQKFKNKTKEKLSNGVKKVGNISQNLESKIESKVGTINTIERLITKLISKLTPNNLKIQKIFLILTIILGISAYGIAFYIRSQYYPLIILLVIFIVSYRYLKKFSTIKFKNIDLLMALWFLTILTFYSLYFVKVDRYILPMFPPLIYFVLKGLNNFFTVVRGYIKNRDSSTTNKIHNTSPSNSLNKSSNIYKKHSNRFLKIFTFENIVIVLTCLLVITSGLGQEYVSSEKVNYYENYQIDDILSWFNRHDPSFKSKKMWADPYGQFYGWYLKTPIKSTFYSNHTRLESHLNTQKVDYYISTTEYIEKYNFTSFENFTSVDLGGMNLFYRSANFIP